MNLREAEAQSIRQFVRRAGRDGYLRGRVIDYGCGQQPYRELVEKFGGEYVGYDRVDFPGNVSCEDIGFLEAEEEALGFTIDWDDWNAVLCNQVLQYVPDAAALLMWFRHILSGKTGHLVMTYPTNWPEVEPWDLHRFTKAGMDRLLTDAGFEIVRHDWRHGFHARSGESFTAGYGVIARA